MPDPVQVVTRLGGVATWRQLRSRTHWRRISASLDSGAIVRTAPGRYAIPTADLARVAASRLTGVSSHTSAAAYWDWAVKVVPADPHVIVGRKRKLTPAQRDGVVLRYRELAQGDIVDGWVTSPERTVIDCCLDLPFDEALAVFDSSWRGGLKPRVVQQRALSLPTRQRNRVLALAEAADPRAANPFESVLRARSLDVAGLRLTPQVALRDGRFYARVDLADERLAIVAEADSFEFHGQRAALDRDCRRYNALVTRGWLVLRFSWEQVMFDAAGVAQVLTAAVAQQGRRRPARGEVAEQRIRRASTGRSTGTRAGTSPRSA